MKNGLERLPNYPYKPSEVFGPPPSFDLSAAYVAYADALFLIRDMTRKDMPATTSAVALMLFNRGMTRDQARNSDPFMCEIGRLVEIEEVARQPGNPLPTTGFEIEFPIEHAKRQANTSLLKYEALSDAFGLPPNNNNGEDAHERRDGFYLPTDWEVAPHFSYFHETQGRIISELFRARFMLPFREKILKKIYDSPNPHTILLDAIYTYVSHQGLSLHLNYGIPDNIIRTLGYEADYLILGAAASIAFASQNRLEVEAIGAHLVKPNSGEKSLKTNADGYNRLEFRGFEVLDEDVYTTLEAMQLLTTTLLEANKSDDEHHPVLAKLWNDCIYSLFDMFPEELHDFEKVRLGESLKRREVVAELAKNHPEVRPAIQQQLLKTAYNARTYLQELKLYPLS